MATPPPGRASPSCCPMPASGAPPSSSPTTPAWTIPCASAKPARGFLCRPSAPPANPATASRCWRASVSTISPWRYRSGTAIRNRQGAAPFGAVTATFVAIAHPLANPRGSDRSPDRKYIPGWTRAGTGRSVPRQPPLSPRDPRRRRASILLHRPCFGSFPRLPPCLRGSASKTQLVWFRLCRVREGLPSTAQHLAVGALPPPRLLGQILGQEQAALAAAHDVEVAVAIQIRHGNLHAAAHPAAVNDNVANPLDGAFGVLAVLIPIDAERFALAGVVAVVGHVALAGDQVLLAIAVEIHQHRGVRLRPCVVDDMVQPFSVGRLLEPHQAVIVSATGEHVHPAVLVDIDGVHEAELDGAAGGRRGAGGGDGVLLPVRGMELPLAGSAHIGGGFQPAFGGQYVVAPVAVDVAHADAVAVTLMTDDMFDPLAVH